MPEPASDAVRARSFGAVAEQYDRARPGYPAEAIAWALGAAPLDVVDLGAGTGKLTEALVAAGHRVLAIEPSDGMRAVLTRKFRSAPVDVVTASAESTGLPEHSADAVVAGASFHWFDTARAIPEAARVLRPGGVLALLGSTFDRGVPWVQDYRSILGEGRRDGGRHWPEADEFLPRFVDVEDRRIAFDTEVDLDRLLDLAVSRSSIATMSAADREDVFERIRALWSSHPDLRDRDTAVLPYFCLVRRGRVADGA